MVDNTKPSTVWNKDNNTWYPSNQTVTLTCIDGAGSSCDTTSYRIDADPSDVVSMGAWQSYTVPFTVSGDGNFEIDFNSTDKAGNIGDVNRQYLLIDTNAPVTTSDVNVGVWQNFNANVNLTCSDAQGSRDVSGCAITKYRVDLNGTDVNVTYGTWQTYTGAILFSNDGNYAIDFNSMDNTGNIETTHTQYVLIDKTSPVVSSDVNDDSWQDTGIGVVLSCTDPNTDNNAVSGCNTIRYKLDTDATANVSLPGSWTVYSTPIVISTDGNYAITFDGNDSAGNWSTTLTQYALVDVTAPTTTSDVNVGTWQKYDANVGLTCTDGNGSGCLATYYRVDTDGTDNVSQGLWQTYTGAGITILGDGNFAIDFNSLDNNSHYETTQTFYVLIDKTPPSVSWDGNSSWQNFDANVGLTCHDTNPDGNAVSGCRTINPILYSLDTNATDINVMTPGIPYTGSGISFAVDGNWALDWNGIDNAGNISDINSGVVLIDKTAPIQTVDFVADFNMTGFNVGGSGTASTDWFAGRNQLVTIVINYIPDTAKSVSPFVDVNINPVDVNTSDVNFNILSTYNSNNLTYSFDVNTGSSFDVNFLPKFFKISVKDAAGNVTYDVNNLTPLIVYAMDYPSQTIDHNSNSTNFQDINDFERISSLKFTRSGYGKVLFLEDVNLADSNTAEKLQEFESHFNVSKLASGDLNVFLDSSYFDDLNKNALISGYNLPYSSVPGVLYNDSNCSSTVCFNIDYNSTTRQIDINVAHFSEYITDGNAPNTVADYNANWQDANANVVLTCTDVGEAGCNTTYYKVDTNALTGTSYPGSWSTYSTAISFTADGNYGLQFYSTDNVGNIEDTNTVYILIDKNAPTVSITSPANNSETTSNNVTVSYSVSDGNGSGLSTAWVSDDNVNWTNNGTNTSYTFTYTGGLPKTKTYYIKVTDATDHNSNTASVTVTYNSATSGSSTTSPTPGGGTGIPAYPPTPTETTVETIYTDSITGTLTESQVNSVASQAGLGSFSTNKALDLIKMLEIKRTIEVQKITTGSEESFLTMVKIIVTNKSSNDLTGLKIIDLLPESFNLTSDNITKSSSAYKVLKEVPLILNFDLGDLSANSSAELSYTLNESLSSEQFNAWNLPIATVSAYSVPVTCNTVKCDVKPCLISNCNPETSRCEYKVKADGTPCGDNLVCVQGECKEQPMQEKPKKPVTPKIPLEIILGIIGVIVVLIIGYLMMHARKLKPAV